MGVENDLWVFTLSKRSWNCRERRIEPSPKATIRMNPLTISGIMHIDARDRFKPKSV